MPTEVRTGTVLAGFRVEALIGEGAMGAVYLAENTRGQGRVALKVLAPEAARDERFRQRFLRESQAAASIDHPNVVPTLASGEADGLLYLAMAYVGGSDLRTLLRAEGPLEPERAVLAQVAGALDAAHLAGLVHRDVKPANILVAPDPDGERAYVCDERRRRRRQDRNRVGALVAVSTSGTANVGGAGIGNLSGRLTLEKSIVIGNHAAATGVGGLVVGGGILNIAFGGPVPTLALTDSVVTANRLSASGPGFDPQGGGIFSKDPFGPTTFAVSLTRTVIAGNKPDQCVGGC